MKPGDVCPMKSANVNTDNAEFGFKVRKPKSGDRFIFLYLGYYNGGEAPFAVEQALRNLGWIPESEAN